MSLVAFPSRLPKLSVSLGQLSFHLEKHPCSCEIQRRSRRLQDIYNSASHLVSLCCPSLSPQQQVNDISTTHHTPTTDIPLQPHHQPHSNLTPTTSSPPNFTPSTPTTLYPPTTTRVDSIYQCSRYARGLRNTFHKSHPRLTQNGMATPLPALAHPLLSPHPSGDEGRAGASRLPHQRHLSRRDNTSRTLDADNGWLASFLASAAPSVPRTARRSG